MTTQTPDLATVLERVERLERQNRWLKTSGGVLALLVLSLLPFSLGLLSLSEWLGPGRIVAREFLLVDEGGRRRALLRSAGGEAALELYGAHGTPRVELAAQNEQSRLGLYEANGQTQVALTTGKERPGLLVGDMPLQGKVAEQATLGVGEGGPKLAFINVQWERDIMKTVERIILATTKDGPRFSLRDVNGKPVFSKP
jgi:hypothetical protein